MDVLSFSQVKKLWGWGKFLEEELTKLADHVFTEDGTRTAVQLGCRDTAAPKAGKNTKSPQPVGSLRPEPPRGFPMSTLQLLLRISVSV